MALLLFLMQQSVAQPLELSKPVCRALNNYLLFSNEAMHAAQVMYHDFEAWNIGLNGYSEGKTDTLPTFYQEVLTNYDYYPTLPRELYQNIVADNLYLPFAKRGKPLEIAGKIENVLGELDGLRYELYKYGSEKKQLKDKQLQQAYALLKRAEVLYADLFALQGRLYPVLKELYREYEYAPKAPEVWQVLQKMDEIIRQCQASIRMVRIDENTPELERLLEEIAQNTARLKINRNACVRSFAPNQMPLDLDLRYDAFVERGEDWLRMMDIYRRDGNPKYAAFSRPKQYYYYNAEALRHYNRYGDGLVGIYNYLATTAGELALLQIEYPMMYEVSLPVKLRDTTDRKQVLEGYAANHFVFLIDLSTSMNDTAKLPLLQQSLRGLLDLLRPEDNISIVTYTGRAQVALLPTSAAQKWKILDAVNGLEYGGGSNAKQGLQKAYDIGLEHYIKNGNNRIILATDGVFKLDMPTERLIRKGARKNLLLSVFYFNKVEITEVRNSLQRISGMGKGNYRYIQPQNAQEQLLREAQAIKRN